MQHISQISLRKIDYNFVMLPNLSVGSFNKQIDLHHL